MRLSTFGENKTTLGKGTRRGGTIGNPEIYAWPISVDEQKRYNKERCNKCRTLLNGKNSGLCSVCGTYAVRKELGVLGGVEVGKHERYVEDSLREFFCWLEKKDMRSQEESMSAFI